MTTEISDPTLKESFSPSPALEVVDTSHGVMTTVLSTAKRPTGFGSALSTANTEVEEHQLVHTHIPQNGVTTTKTLKLAAVPARPGGDFKLLGRIVT